MSLSDEPEHEESPAPMMVPAMLKAVVVAFVEVALMPVKFWSVVEPATSRSPEELIVVVAVEPKYAVPTLEKLVVDAPAAKSWRAVQVLLFARSRETVPLVVIVPPERPLPAVMLVTVPEPPPEGVVVAMTTPEGLTARNVPAGVPRDEMVRLVVDAVSA